MARGANTMALSTNGWTPLTVAIYWAIGPTSYERDSKEAATAETLKMLAKDILNAPDFKAEHIDAVNDEEGTALHYATAYAMPELVPLLLKRGARMDMQGGQMYQFEEKNLESFLDACISYESQGKKVSECILKFDYTFMVNSLDKETSEVEKEKKPDKTTESKNAAKGGGVVVDLKSGEETDEAKNEDPPDEAAAEEKDIVTTEMTLLEDLAGQHRNLLKHPLPRAFLMLKWRKINTIYKTWIAMKVFFLFLLVVFVARNFGHFVGEGEALWRSRNLTVMVNGTDGALHLDTTNYVLLVPISFLLTIFLLVELLQFLVYPYSWLLEPKSWLQLIILAASTVLLLAFWRITSIKLEVVRQVVAYLLPLIYYEFLHELGCHPRFSKYILLFKRISVKFLKYTSIYIGMVLMCAFSFSVMIPRDDWVKNEEKEGLVSMILNTILMFIGEVGVPRLSKEFFSVQVMARFTALIENMKVLKPGNFLPGLCLLHCDCLDEPAERVGSGGRQGDAQRCRDGDVARAPHHRRLLGEGFFPHRFTYSWGPSFSPLSRNGDLMGKMGTSKITHLRWSDPPKKIRRLKHSKLVL